MSSTRIRSFKKKEALNPSKKTDRCKGHYYPFIIILICLRLVLGTSIAFRCLSEALKILNIRDQYNIDKTPSHTTIRRWSNRVGLYQLTKEKEKAPDWCYIVDNSIRVENRKLCLILGIRLSRLKKGKYVTFEDTEILEMGLIQGKITEGVTKLLKSAIQKTGVPLQICSDQGNDIVPAIKHIKLKYPKIKHIPDIVHATTNMLRKMLEKNTKWEEFSKKVGETKNVLKQSFHSELCPPQIRGKSRFLNCSVIVEWAMRVLELLKNKDCDEEVKMKLNWLLKYKKDLIVIQDLIKVVQLTNELVRLQGINSTTYTTAAILFKKEVMTSKGRKLVKEVMKFIKQLSDEAGDNFLIGSSEIIESAFGKLKTLDRECGNSGFTSSMLGLGACFGKLDYEVVVQAIESISEKDVEEWKKIEIGETQQNKRRRLLKSEKRVNLKQKLTRVLEEKMLAA